jgi:hypothetical protein
MVAPESSIADVVDIDKARRARAMARKVAKPIRQRAATIRINLTPAGRLAYHQSHNTKQDAYTLMLGCCIMLGRMFRELGDTWGR